MYMRSPNAKVLVREERVVLCNTRNGGFVKTSEAYFQYLENIWKRTMESLPLRKKILW